MSATGTDLRTRFHPESEFGGFSDIDGTIPFFLRARELLPADGVALDIGCGRGTQDEDPVRVRRELRILRGHCRRTIGIDVDPAAADNSHIDEFHLIGPDGRWPLPAASVDMAIADFVIEHVADPDSFFAQAARVVRPGGHLGIRTINVHSYLGVGSLLVPNRLHRAVLRRAQPDRAGEDVFPTLYRCNTIRKLRGALERHGFEAAVYGFEAEPDYLAFSRFAYALGLLHRRLAPGRLRVGLVAWARRRGA
jgi:SAM-dependent methyltransferase